MPVAEKPQMENILDKRINKRTRRKNYFEYLVKWKGHPVEDASWECYPQYLGITRRSCIEAQGPRHGVPRAGLT
jgi:hypothetical protein